MTPAAREHRIGKNTEIDVDELNVSGWTSCKIDVETEDQFALDLLALGNQLGSPIATRSGSSFCDRVTPKDAPHSRSRSLSRIFSLGEFPLHVDTAHWVVPCRFLVLGCFSPGTANRCTELLDTSRLVFSEVQRNLLHNAVFRIKNGRFSFFGSILSKSQPFIRLDEGCMHATSDTGEVALTLFQKKEWGGQIEQVHWETGDVLIINNWRVLHGRGGAMGVDGNRTLLRVSIR